MHVRRLGGAVYGWYWPGSTTALPSCGVLLQQFPVCVTTVRRDSARRVFVSLHCCRSMLAAFQVLSSAQSLSLELARLVTAVTGAGSGVELHQRLMPLPVLVRLGIAHHHDGMACGATRCALHPSAMTVWNSCRTRPTWVNHPMFFLLQGGRNLLAGHTLQSSEPDCRRPAAPIRHAKRPYSRRCPAPGPKTSAERRSLTPTPTWCATACSSAACCTHPTDFVSRPNKGVLTLLANA
jgi:hypothetical protein